MANRPTRSGFGHIELHDADRGLFAMVPAAQLQDPALTANDHLALSWLRLYAYLGRGTYPGNAQLARDMHKSLAQTERILHHLTTATRWALCHRGRPGETSSWEVPNPQLALPDDQPARRRTSAGSDPAKVRDLTPHKRGPSQEAFQEQRAVQALEAKIGRARTMHEMMAELAERDRATAANARISTEAK
jgi:hypothetical protein